MDLDTLPPEILINILSQSNITDILKFCQVSRYGNLLCNDENLWRGLIRRDFGLNYQGSDSKREYFRLYHWKNLINRDYGDYAFTSELKGDPEELYRRLSEDELINSAYFRRFYIWLYNLYGTTPIFYNQMFEGDVLDIYPKIGYMGQVSFIANDKETLARLTDVMFEIIDIYDVEGVGAIMSVHESEFVDPGDRY
jgi:hypothetical protein